MKFEAKYGVGDVVFNANAYRVDSDIIKAIKFVGLKKKVEYGFKRTQNTLTLFWNSDEYYWLDASAVFDSEEEATRVHESLKAKAELEAKKAELEEIQELEEQLAAAKKEFAEG